MPLAPGLQAAIVDLDGTLVDTLGDFTVALNATLDELSLRRLTAADIEPMVGKGSEHLIRSALSAVDAPQRLYDAAWAAYQRHYDEINGRHSDVYPGVEEGLEVLRRSGLRLACVTNKPTRFAADLLQRKGLAKAFDAVFGGDAFERKKPDPLPFVRTCEALGAAPSRTLVVGDSSNDAAAARAAGCPVVLVTYGYNHGEPVGSVDADGFVDSLAQIGRLL
ncbi:phosphoglycolate phosphatase [Ramlibacter henchirensis]|uniref:Phosphoglycolate phosphatase n=1 Tax=Ramlibacter henchirensis TaxID=204072 RepID=A0A4Z0C8A9_9BURK|nr:phosphoglycolate phosphatase [Ramlibacter henchirensis]TFZ06608.1 phosphoglycolate phosphatase [Ramlibacter henchirensis]